MRSVILLCMVAFASPVAADGARKSTPDKFERAAGELFAKAIAEEDRGKLLQAINLYKGSLEIAVHPNTVYNLAVVQAKHGKLHDAIVSYEMYLALVPNAPDARAVAATIAELRKRPSSIWIHARDEAQTTAFDLADAYILLDGEIISRPGAIKRGGGRDQGIHAKAGPGRHTIDVVTAVHSFYEGLRTTYGEKRTVEVFSRKNRGGNVFLQAPRMKVWGLHVGKDERIDEQGSRFTLTPGKHRMKVTDRGHECTPIELDAPKGNAVLYVRVEPAELLTLRYEEPRRCRKLSVIKRVLTF